MAVRRGAGKSGAATLAAVRKALGSGWPAGLTVLAGDDLYHLDLAQRLLLEHLAPAESSEFALTVFGEERTPVAEIVVAARSIGMFSPRRVVFVRAVSAFDGEPDALVEYAARPPAQSYLIVRAVDLDQRFKLHKALASAGKTFVFSVAQDAGATLEELRSMAEERGVKLGRDAVMQLARATGGDLYRVASELDKLRAWQGEGASRAIDLETVRALVPASDEMSGWELSDAITARDREGALAALRVLLDRGDEPLMLVGGIAARARVMLQAKAMLARRVPPDAVVAATRSYPFKRQLLDGLGRYSLRELLGFPDLVRQADRALKGGGLSAEAVLGDLVERMIPPRNAARAERR